MHMVITYDNNYLETLCLDVLAEGTFNLALLRFILVAAAYKICEISKLSCS